VLVSKKEKQFLNLWELKPKRNAEWETNTEGNVVVLFPKFQNPFLVKWILPYLSKPFFKIKLDAVGSAIWKQCDGINPVSIIAESLKQQFGESIEPIEKRINSFLNQLERGDLIIIEEKVL
jgi:hypothetical protein